MKILCNPRFNNQIDIIKNNVKNFAVVEIEKQLKSILENPINAEKLGETNFYKKIFEVYYEPYIVIYEYDIDKNQIIFASIE